MSKLTTSFEALRAAFDTFTAADEASGLPEARKPLYASPFGKPVVSRG